MYRHFYHPRGDHVKDPSKTKQELLIETATLRQRNQELEQSEEIRKQAEAALRESEAKWKEIFETIEDLYYEVDSEGVIKLLSPSVHRLTGWDEEDLIGKPVSMVYADPHDRERLLSKLSEKAYVHDYELVLKKKDGEKRQVSLSASTIVDDNGRPIGVRGLLRDITERKRTEEALLESEAKYRIVVESSLVGVYVVQNGLFRFVNERWCEIYGYTYGEIVNKIGPLDLTPSEDRNLLTENFRKPLSGKVNHIEYDLRAIRKDGRIIIVKILGSFMLFNGLPAISGTVHDITESKLAEEKLRESDRQLREAQEMAHLGFWNWDIKSGHVEWSDEVFKIFCLDPKDFTPRIDSILALSPWPEDHQRDQEIIKRAIENHKPGSYEQKFLRPDQSIGYYYSTFQGKYDEKGDLISIVGTVLDVTSRKQAEEALRTSQLQLTEAMELAHIVYWEFDPLTQTYIFNDSFYTFYGTTANQEGGYAMIREDYAKRFIHPDDVPIFAQFVKQNTTRSDSKTVADIEHRIVRRNGEVRHILARTRTVKDDSGRVIKRYGATQDITEQKRADEMLMDLFKDLEKKNVELENTYDELRESQQKIIQQEKMASIGQLAAGIAHEINNPVGFVMSNINSMGKYSERLFQFIKIQSEAVDRLSKQDGDTAVVLDGLHKKRRALKIDYVINDFTNVIKESLEGTERVKRIVQDLKNFSHKDEDEHKPADINEGIESTINVVWNELKYKANVTKEYGKIPLTKCNLGQLNQVFMNLLINAVQAIEEHGEISIKTERRDGDIVVSISDTGSGIQEDKLNRIFEPFFTTKEVGKGTGLGLSIAYDIVKKHSGEILVTSEIGKGSTFTITIPVVER